MGCCPSSSFTHLTKRCGARSTSVSSAIRPPALSPSGKSHIEPSSGMRSRRRSACVSEQEAPMSATTFVIPAWVSHQTAVKLSTTTSWEGSLPETRYRERRISGTRGGCRCAPGSPGIDTSGCLCRSLPHPQCGRHSR
jgi:hypothetical protein